MIPKLLFVLGKGGVGRTTVSLGLARALATKGKRTLIVQWALEDSIAPRFHKKPCGHKEVEILPNVSIMNFETDEAIKEYFVDHLGYKLLYKLVIENKHVQRLIHAAPGVQELFFLGRLFWLCELATKERGWSYDHIIVDSPATRHGVSLFRIPATIASLGMAGPLADECARVDKLLKNSGKTASIVVTLPEELPIEETVELLPKVTKELGRSPLFLILNKATPKNFEAADAEFVQLMERASDAWKHAIVSVKNESMRRINQQKILFNHALKIPSVTLSDVHFLIKQPSEDEISWSLAQHLEEVLQ